MNFDELWRTELASKPDVAFSAGTSGALDSFDLSSTGFELEDLDEREVNRFLEWLESSLLSG